MRKMSTITAAMSLQWQRARVISNKNGGLVKNKSSVLDRSFKVIVFQKNIHKLFIRKT